MSDGEAGQQQVEIIATGVGNTASVVAAFGRLGCTARLIQTPAEVEAATRLVLPGVGSFAAAMQQLGESGLIEPLRLRVQRGRPTLAICLGLQLLGLGSDESREVPGLGCAPVRAEQFAAGLRVPHMGWNQVKPEADCKLLGPGAAYFAHSFLWSQCPAGWSAATTVHGLAFVAAIERGAVLACQFHPELSGEYGAALLSRWLQAEAVPC